MTRPMLCLGFLLAATCAFAQNPPPAPPAPPAPAAAPAAPQTPKLLPPARIPPTPPPPPPSAAPPAPPAPPALPVSPHQPINIKVDLTITEEGGNLPPMKKTVSTVAGDGFNGSVRETATLAGPSPIGPTMLNFDAAPTLVVPERQARGGINLTPAASAADKIRVYFNIQYSAGQGQTRDEPRPRTDIRLNLTLLLENGKTLKVWEGADPIDKDRRVTVEATATILK